MDRFNREDLITWSELAPSFKEFLRSLASSNEQIAQLLNDKLGQLDKIQRTLDRNRQDIDKLNDLSNITIATLAAKLMEIKIMMTAHNLNSLAHVPAMDTAADTTFSAKYHVGQKLKFDTLNDLLTKIDNGTINEMDAVEDNPVVLGEAELIHPLNKNSMVPIIKDILSVWLTDTAFDGHRDDDDAKKDYVITLFNNLHKELFDHEWDVNAHAFNSSFLLAKDREYFLEKEYRVFVGSDTNAKAEITHPTPTPSTPYEALTDLTVPGLYVKALELENDFYTHVLSTDAHGVNTIFMPLNTKSSDNLYEISITAKPISADKFEIRLVKMEIPATGNTASFGMSYEDLYSFLDNVKAYGDGAAYTMLRELVDRRIELYEHEEDNDPHVGLNFFMMHKPDTEYKEGAEVYAAGLPTNYRLYAMNDGRTSMENETIKALSEATNLSVNELRRLKLAERKRAFEDFLLQLDVSKDINTELMTTLKSQMQDLLNHEYDEEAHSRITPIAMSHQKDHDYLYGETVYVRGLVYPMMIEALNDGKTATTIPTSLDLGMSSSTTPPTAPDVDKKNKPAYLAQYNINYTDHLLDENCHQNTYGGIRLYKKGTYNNGTDVWPKYDPRYRFLAESAGTTDPNGTDYGEYPRT